MCSCSKGFNGAACKHQAAVAKAFNVCTVNLAPYYSKEARKMFADLAMGEKSMAQSFMQTCEVQLMQTAVHLQKIQIILQTAVHLQKILKMVLIMKTTVPVLSPPQTTWTVMGQIHLKNR